MGGVSPGLIVLVIVFGYLAFFCNGNGKEDRAKTKDQQDHGTHEV